jgi:hypothetical protein
MCVCRNPHDPTRSSPGPSSSQAQRVKELFQLLSGVLTTHRNSSAISPSLLGKSGFAISRNSLTLLVQNKTPNPELRWSKVNAPSYRGFPYREIIACDVNNLTFQTPSPEVPIFQYNATWTPLLPVAPHCHVTFEISRIANP